MNASCDWTDLFQWVQIKSSQVKLPLIIKGDIRTFNTNNKTKKPQYNEEKKYNEEGKNKYSEEEW